jgi:hypothetical protein
MYTKTILFESGNRYLRRLALALLIAVLVNPNAFALGPIGPSTTDILAGEFEFGIDYSKSTIDVELNNGKWTEWLNGAFHNAGEAQTFKITDFEMSKIYANLGYGILDNCELFLRLGTVDTKFGDSIWEDGEKFDSKTHFSFCIGSRATFYEDGDFKLGRLIQVSWANMDGDLKAPQWDTADPIDLDLMEVLIAVGPTYQFAERASIYGGPFLYFADGDITDKFSETTEEGGTLTSEYSWDIDESSNFGGYIGLNMEIAQSTFFNIEYIFASGGNAVGLGINCRF